MRPDSVSNHPAASGPQGPVDGLYVHIPFCTRKCEYCAFFSEPALELVDRFVNALVREIALSAPLTPPRTIFFGGGTPTLLTLHQWEKIFQGLRDRFGAPPAPSEWTVECNPASLSADKAKLLLEAGVDRISLGIQSLDEQLLQRLGRLHTREQVFESFDLLRRVGFDNVNLDLMFAIPGQTLELWRATLREALALQSEHLSAYEVIYEEDTPLFQQLQAGRIDVDEDLASAMYAELLSQADAHGLRQYEIANFAQEHSPTPGPVPSRACQHNVTYWRGRPYLGLGPSACSFTQGSRYRTPPNTTLYCEQLEQGRSPTRSEDPLSPLARAGEIAAFGLRMLIGWPFEDFLAVTGFDLRQHWQSEMDELVGRGWAVQNHHSFRLTPQGLRFADAAAEAFLVSNKA